MDNLEEWRVRGRIATAIVRMRETLSRLAVDSEELNAAMAEAESLSPQGKSAAAAGVVL